MHFASVAYSRLLTSLFKLRGSVMFAVKLVSALRNAVGSVRSYARVDDSVSEQPTARSFAVVTSVQCEFCRPVFTNENTIVYERVQFA